MNSGLPPVVSPDAAGDRCAYISIGVVVAVLLALAAWFYWNPAVKIPARLSVRQPGHAPPALAPVAAPSAAPSGPYEFSHGARFGSRSRGGHSASDAAFGPPNVELAHGAMPPRNPDGGRALRDAIDKNLAHRPKAVSRRHVTKQSYYYRPDSARPESSHIASDGHGSDYAHSAVGQAAVTGTDSLLNFHYPRGPPKVDPNRF
jgi:hypothetical protein